MNRKVNLFWLRTAVWVVLLYLGCESVASACPNCKDAIAGDPAQAGLVRGFFWSILFMLSMPFLILGGIGSYFYWEVCRARRAATAVETVSAREASADADSGLAADEKVAPLVAG